MSTPNSAKNIALHGIGLLLSMSAAAVIPLVANIGRAIQSNPTAASGIAGAVGAILYAWALWTFSLWKKDSKKEEIAHAHATGRIICPCTKTGEILTFCTTIDCGSGVDVYCCAECGNYHVLGNAQTFIGEGIQFNPPLPEKARAIWLEDSKQARNE